jgi:hypothetical protein
MAQRIIGAAGFFPLRCVVDRIGEIAVLFQQQRIGLLKVERDRIFALDLDLVG